VNRRYVFYWLIAVVIAALAIAAAFHFDYMVSDFIAQHQIKPLRKVMETVSKLGDWPLHFVTGLIALGIAWCHGNKKWTRVFLSMLIAMALAGLAGQTIKRAFPRARPSVHSEVRWGGPRFSSKYHAFPSGHVVASTAFFGVLLLARRRVGLACLPIPIVIGLSRMYVEAHYLSDVVCAALLGAAGALIVTQFFLRRSPTTDH
jgi:undecaprenyl-diphosphatase